MSIPDNSEKVDETIAELKKEFLTHQTKDIAFRKR